MSDTVSVRKGDVDILVAACTSWMPPDASPEVGNAFRRMLTAFDEAHADEDEPGNEPAKVIVVAEAGGRERRYAADEGDDHTWSGRLLVKRAGRRVGGYNDGAWLSWREDGAEAPDGNDRALRIAKTALNTIAAASRNEIGDKMRQIADAALEDIFAETDL